MMKRKFIKSEFKQGCIDNIKLLGLAEDVLKYLVTRDDINLTSAEYHEFSKAFGIMLDTAFFFLPYQERYALLQKLQNGEITPSKAEKQIFKSEGIPKPSSLKDYIWYGGKYIPKMNFKYYKSNLIDAVDLSAYIDYLPYLKGGK